MTSTRRRFGREFKVDALRRVENGLSVREVARLSGVDVNTLRRWRRDYEVAREFAFPGPGRPRRETGIAELRRLVEQHTLEIEYLLSRIRKAEEKASGEPESREEPGKVRLSLAS
jgi:transposase-like protein